VRGLLVAAAVRHKDVLAEPAPDAIFTGFGDSSLDFELRFWTMTRVQTPLILKSDLYFAIFESFRVNAIEIPFPQRDVYLRAVPPELRVDPGPQSRAE
jgi:small-conductance mechanosensitive channel